MRVVYATPMIKKIMGAISDAKCKDREIAYIEVTHSELHQLLEELHPRDFMCVSPYTSDMYLVFHGVQIKVAR